MKFELIISNPPYNDNLDLKILDSVYHLGNNICFVHPARWLLNKKPNYRFADLVNKIKNDIKYYEDIKNSNNIFKINAFVHCAILLFEKQCNVVNIDDIDIHGSSKTYKTIKHKILSYCKNNCLEYHNRSEVSKSWEVGIPSIRGHPYPANDMYTLIQRHNSELHIGPRGSLNYDIKIGFNTRTEAVNFVNYLKLKITRFCISIYKIAQNINTGELASVPYMPTYEKEWTDKEVADEIGITDEELEWILEWTPNYYLSDEKNYKKIIK